MLEHVRSLLERAEIRKRECEANGYSLSLEFWATAVVKYTKQLEQLASRP